MNSIDILISVLIVITVLRGVEIGLVRQAASLIGIVGGVLLGSRIAGLLGLPPITHVVVVLGFVMLATMASELIGFQLKQRLAATHINHFDKSLGGAMGVVTCLALVWLGSTLISAFPAPDMQQGIRDSKIIAWLDRSLPPATDVLSQLERSFVDTGLPELFGTREPQLETGDTSLPDLALFSDVLAQTRASIVEIEGRSCQGIGVGSGFVVGQNQVMTNAHVVAGMRVPYIKDDNGRHSARVIAFDPDLDIAILETGNLAGLPLQITATREPVSTPAAVVGYPGGGPYTAEPARIIDIFTAVGRDIYDENTSERDLYALRATVQPGNSGGPVINQSGQVIAVVFARSTTYDRVGYAITAPEVQAALARANTAPSAGTSARCL